MSETVGVPDCVLDVLAFEPPELPHAARVPVRAATPAAPAMIFL
jgi:hypothetical protein